MYAISEIHRDEHGPIACAAISLLSHQVLYSETNLTPAPLRPTLIALCRVARHLYGPGDAAAYFFTTSNPCA
jgi:hypothetical protein